MTFLLDVLLSRKKSQICVCFLHLMLPPTSQVRLLVLMEELSFNILEVTHKNV